MQIYYQGIGKLNNLWCTSTSQRLNNNNYFIVLS